MRRLQITAAVALLLLLFLGNPHFLKSRVFAEIWNLGHVFAFALWTWLLFKQFGGAKLGTWKRQAIAVFLFTLCAGVLTEGLQFLVHRSPTFEDIGRDILGGAIFLAFLTPARHDFEKPTLRKIQAGVLLCFSLALAPLVSAGLDTWRAKVQFPALAGFESVLETGRWEFSSHLTRVRRESAGGDFALAISPKKTEFSGVYFKYFPSDWREYTHLRFEVFNPWETSIDIFIRIHDRNHQSREANKKDRYSVSRPLPPGWHTVSIDLADVANAPQERSMDMRQIWRFGIFLPPLPLEEAVLVDDFRLEEQ